MNSNQGLFSGAGGGGGGGRVGGNRQRFRARRGMDGGVRVMFLRSAILYYPYKHCYNF